MGKHTSNIELLAIKMDRRNDPILVSANVKNVVISNPISSVESRLQRGEILKSPRLDNLAPGLQRFAGVRIALGEFDQGSV